MLQADPQNAAVRGSSGDFSRHTHARGKEVREMFPKAIAKFLCKGFVALDTFNLFFFVLKACPSGNCCVKHYSIYWLVGSALVSAFPGQRVCFASGWTPQNSACSGLGACFVSFNKTLCHGHTPTCSPAPLSCSCLVLCLVINWSCCFASRAYAWGPQAWRRP